MSLPGEDGGDSKIEQPTVTMSIMVADGRLLTFENPGHSSKLPYFVIDVSVKPLSRKGNVMNVSMMGLKDSGSTHTVINYELLQCLPGYRDEMLKRFPTSFPINLASKAVSKSTRAVGEIQMLLTFTSVSGEALTFKHTVKVCTNLSKDLFIGQDILDSENVVLDDKKSMYFCDNNNTVHRIPLEFVESQRCKSVANAVLENRIEIEPNSHELIEVEFAVARQGLYHLEPYDYGDDVFIADMAVMVNGLYGHAHAVVGNLSSEPIYFDPGQGIGTLDRIDFFQNLTNNYSAEQGQFADVNWLTLDKRCDENFHDIEHNLSINHGKVSAQMDFEQHGARDAESRDRKGAKASTVEELIMEDKYLTVNEKRDAVEEYRKNGFHPLPASTLVDRNSGQILEESREIRASRSGSSTGGSGFARIRGHVKSKI